MEILAESLPPAFDKKELAALQQFRQAIANQQNIQLFEGLHHSYWKPDEFKKERDSKPTKQQDSEYFYAEPLTLTPVDESLILELLSQIMALEKTFGVKSCGGYHADWLLEWQTSPGQLHHLQICLGCGEVNVKGPGYLIHADINYHIETKLAALLNSYATNQPPHPQGELVNE